MFVSGRKYDAKKRKEKWLKKVTNSPHPLDVLLTFEKYLKHPFSYVRHTSSSVTHCY